MRKGLLVLTVLLVLAPPAAADEWLQRTLDFQYRLGSTLPLVNAPWVGTHNSFNSTTEPLTLSGQDANQRTSLTQQLDFGIRSLELDVHNIAGTPLVCHGRGADEAHAGCTTERRFDVRLAEIRAWLDAHPTQVVLLYLEDHLEGAFDPAAKMLDDVLGAKLYRPPPGACTGMPLSVSRRDIARAGKQVLAISSCGEGTTWRGLVFDDAEREKNESGAGDFHPETECGFQDQFKRFFEDSTKLSELTGTPVPLTPEVTAAMTDCGVDLFGFDQITEDDGRLAATIWTWAPGQPSRSGCVVLRDRFRVASCAKRHRFACRTATGLTVSPKAAAYKRRPKGCRRGLPRTGYEAARLREAAGGKPVWLRLKV